MPLLATVVRYQRRLGKEIRRGSVEYVAENLALASDLVRTIDRVLPRVSKSAKFVVWKMDIKIGFIALI
jgi:hypothetical protein